VPSLFCKQLLNSFDHCLTKYISTGSTQIHSLGFLTPGTILCFDLAYWPKNAGARHAQKFISSNDSHRNDS